MDFPNVYLTLDAPGREVLWRLREIATKLGWDAEQNPHHPQEWRFALPAALSPVRAVKLQVTAAIHEERVTCELVSLDTWKSRSQYVATIHGAVRALVERYLVEHGHNLAPTIDLLPPE